MTNTKSVRKDSSSVVDQVIKRDGSFASYDSAKITSAVLKALTNTNSGDLKDATKITKLVEKELKRVSSGQKNYIPHVEQVQDLVEKSLMVTDYYEAAKHFILYRQRRAEQRDAVRMTKLESSETFRKSVKESKSFFKSSLSEFVYYTHYARWLDDKGRRETWMETVERFMSFMRENVGDKLSEKDYKEVQEGIMTQDIIPSMRLLWSSGDAARKSHVTAYNCSFIAISDLKDFSEIMYISMCGCGAGFSVEKKSIDRLPTIKEQTGEKLPKHVVGDSKEGWADALYLGLTSWFDGKDIEFDYSKVRPKGARLMTMGGKASGPQPLMDLMVFARDKVLGRQGKKLSSLDVHDIACKVGEIVVAGGVRRSAMISLSDLNDLEMRHAKQGQFWLTSSQRSMANNSAVYEEKPSSAEFMKEWLALAESGSGERGIFNRGQLMEQLPERRAKVFEDHLPYCGTNPCGEIILRSRQFCNLTAIVVRAEDDEASLLRKIRLATILGTYQASLTNFAYLKPDWKKNCEEEALLGVSFTGYYDNKTVRKPEVLRKLRDHSIDVNKTYAKKMGINQSTCITCVKPSGNSSQLLDTSSGMHPRFSKYYVRRVRISSTDALLQMLRDQGVPCHPEVGQEEATATTFVLEFPVKSPEGAITNKDVTGIEFLEEWKKIKENFTEHNPSATVYVGTDEWVAVANWVYENWDIVGGLTFLPRSEHIYQLAPYEEIDKTTYEQLSKQVENVDFSKLVYYEAGDNTTGAKEYACVSGACEL